MTSPTKEPIPGADPAADYESTPLTRQEYISAIVHLYRGELYRANTWRTRLDNTTNWAVLTTAGLLSFAFGPGEHSHWTLLAGLALISIFWAFEARRYRFADVWIVRVRKIEENFYGPILRRDPVSPHKQWGELVAEDLFRPSFKIGKLEALRVRLLRNYWAIFLVVLSTWAVKVLALPPAQNWIEVKNRLGSGVVPWWVPLCVVVGFLLVLLGVLLYSPRKLGAEHEADYDVDPYKLSP